MAETVPPPSSSSGPPEGGGGASRPRFRIVAGRGLNEPVHQNNATMVVPKPEPDGNYGGPPSHDGGMMGPPMQNSVPRRPMNMMPPPSMSSGQPPPQHASIAAHLQRGPSPSQLQQPGPSQPQGHPPQQQMHPQSQHPQQQQHPSQQQQHPSQPQGHHPQQHPQQQQHPPLPMQMMPPPGAIQQPGTPGGGPPQNEERDMVQKCVRFFRTLIQLSQQPDQQTAAGRGQNTAVRVRELVTMVIFDGMPPEEFTRRLQEALRSQAQPHLLPFLQRTLPFLRTALQNGEVQIEGITPPVRPQGMHGPPPPMPPPPIPQQRPQPQPMHPVKMEVDDRRMGGPETSHPPLQPAPVQQHPPPAAAAPAPESESVQTRNLRESVLEGSIVNAEEIMRKITKRMNETCYVEEDVLTLIAEATESRLRGLLANLCVHAEHRLEPLRLNPSYVQMDDTRRQLRFLEEMDKREEERRANQEKAELIRSAKNKGIGKDLQEKAKQVQRAEQEAARNRDANAAAIAALSSSSAAGSGGGLGASSLGARKRPWDALGGSTATTLSSHTVRPKTIRVTLRDLHAVAALDPMCSKLVQKIAYLNPPSESL